MPSRSPRGERRDRLIPDTRGGLNTDDDPLTAPPAKEVSLPNAPLVRVLAQVRFLPILSAERRDFVAPFQEAIRKTYPVLQQELTQGLLLSPQGATPEQRQTVWRFCQADGSWRVSLSPDFVALETTSYTSRSDFMERLRVVLAAVEEHVQPQVVQRIGLRYIDRVRDDALEKIRDLVRPELLGIQTAALSVHAQHSLTETLFRVPESDDQIVARWGRLPPGVTMTPPAVDAIDTASWILDLDMSSLAQRSFASDELTEKLRHYAERIYTFFRWAVTEDFLRRYGGQP